MIIGYNRRPDATVDEKLQSLVESVQLALNIIEEKVDKGSLAAEVNQAAPKLNLSKSKVTIGGQVSSMGDAIDDAAKVATNYLEDVSYAGDDQGGIKVHPANDDTSYVGIDGGSVGIFKLGKKLMELIGSAIRFFDGTGNADSNVVAQFGSTGATIGKATSQHMELADTKLSLTDGTGADVVKMTATNEGAIVYIEPISYSGSVELTYTPVSGTTIAVEAGTQSGDDAPFSLTAGIESSGSNAYLSWSYDGCKQITITPGGSYEVYMTSIRYTTSEARIAGLQVGRFFDYHDQGVYNSSSGDVEFDRGVQNIDGELHLNGQGSDWYYDYGVNDFTGFNGHLFIDERDPFDMRVLWHGGYLMTAGHTAWLEYETNVSAFISEQPHGIVLCFSRYNPSTGEIMDEHWGFQFIPKFKYDVDEGTAPWDGDEIVYTTARTAAGGSITKYLYIHDTYITGHSANSNTGTGYANNEQVLRAIIGV